MIAGKNTVIMPTCRACLGHGKLKVMSASLENYHAVSDKFRLQITVFWRPVFSVYQDFNLRWCFWIHNCTRSLICGEVTIVDNFGKKLHWFNAMLIFPTCTGSIRGATLIAGLQWSTDVSFWAPQVIFLFFVVKNTLDKVILKARIFLKSRF